MRIKTLLPVIGLIVVGAMISPKQVYAALPCDVCADIYNQCIADGHTRAYCASDQPAGCYGCPLPLGVNGHVALKSEPAKPLPDIETDQVAMMAAPH